jgi:hypothetical protein
MISLKSITSSWNRFFFEPQPTEGIAVFRIIWCFILFAYYLLDLYNINDFYGPHAIVSFDTMRNQFPYPHANIFHFLSHTYEAVYAVMAIYGVALLMAMFGFYTRTSLFIVLICVTSLHQRNIWLLSSSELLIRSITIFLLCSPAGHSLSIDSIMGRKFSHFKKPRDWAPWALRLIQIQVSVVYLWTVWHKLKGGDWFDGSAVYYATRLESMTNFPLPYFLDSVLFLRLATWGTLLIETALGTLVWIKEFRKPVIIAGILFHVGIEYTMSIPFFEIIMMALILNFFTPQEYRSFIASLRAWFVKQLRESTLASSLKEKIIEVVGDKPEAI